MKRAYDTASKEARRQIILDAATQLFSSRADQLPSAARIAESAGVAKGTVYLYFDTKEEIFAALLLEGWGRVMDAAEQSMRVAAEPSRMVEAFVHRFVSELEMNPILMPLDALGKGVLEGNMSPAALLAFKDAFHQRLDAAAGVLEAALALPQGRGVQLLIRIHALTRGLWQSLGPASVDSGCSNAPPRFSSELREALSEYWRGALMTHGMVL